MQEEIEYTDNIDEVLGTDGGSWTVRRYVMYMFNVYGLSFLRQCVSFVYSIYLRLTLFNTVIYFLKCIPLGFYTYELIKNIKTSRERLSKKQMELEDIQLQIQIVNTKLCVRDAEFKERSELLKREIERLRRVRDRVRELVAADDSLQRVSYAAAECDSDLDVHGNPQEDTEIIIELLKSLRRNKCAIPEGLLETMEHKPAESEPGPGEHGSLYSALSDIDERQDCRVKIVKVTKVAYLKHYIKQKKLRRVSKRAALKKKMDSILKLFDDWQKTLTMVINSKLTILNVDTHPIDVATQEAMGDYSKPRELSDTDSVHKNEMLYNEYYSLSWTQNPYRSYGYNYEEIPDTAVAQNYYEQQDNGDVKYSAHFQCDGLGRCPKMMSILKETGSQMAIEEASCEPGDDYRDVVAI